MPWVSLQRLRNSYLHGGKAAVKTKLVLPIVSMGSGTGGNHVLVRGFNQYEAEEWAKSRWKLGCSHWPPCERARMRNLTIQRTTPSKAIVCLHAM